MNSAPQTKWTCALELDSGRNHVAGSTAELSKRIGNAADLRIYTEFLHNEHIDVDSSSNERIREVAEFGVTYRIQQEWVAGIMSLRQPIQLPDSFGPRSSMSMFLYNQDASQGIARPFLDGEPATAEPGSSPISAPINMPKYHVADNWDAGTNAPSENFIYDFDLFRYCVSDTWTEVLSHSADGEERLGSIDALVDAFSTGCSIKLGISGLCSELCDDPNVAPEHEVFVQGGSSYYYTEQKLFIIGSHPVVRVQPDTPIRYASKNWDFGWLMVRSDGRVVYRRCDPYTLKFTDHISQHAVRWFVR